MREIKFRAWDKTSKKYRTFDGRHDTMTISRDGKTEYYNLQNGSGGDEYILEQFTGLHDKNGKEIYDGDILKWLGHEVDNGRQIRPERILVISDFIMHSYNLRCLTDGLVNTLEVIGNIHENPELLEASR